MTDHAMRLWRAYMLGYQHALGLMGEGVVPAAHVLGETRTMDADQLVAELDREERRHDR
jgi:hypothetical protein